MPRSVETWLTDQWSAAGTAISGATASTYTPVAADQGKTLTVAVTGTRAGYAPTTTTRAATAAVGAGTLSPAPTPSVAGSSVVGYTLTATPGSWGPDPVALTYQWFRGSTAIPGATTTTYTTLDADVGQPVTVKVTGTKPGYTTTTRTSAATTVTQAGSTLGSGQQLAGSTLLSTGQYRVGVAAGLVETDNNARTLWQGSATGGGRLVMQTDGNLVYYSNSGSALWSSGTSGNAGATAHVSTDGTLKVVSSRGTTLWSNGAYDDRLVSSQSAGTSASLQPGYVLYSPNRAIRLVMQTDGNLVLYKTAGGAALWQSGTGTNAGAYATLQTDGNLVVYAGTSPKWTSGTGSSSAGTRQLLLQNDGNVVLYSSSNTALWQTGTRT